MSVIIQGLKLPAYQGEHKEFDRYGCFLTVYKTGKVELHIFEKDFDVKDIPTPHGRLIDEEAIYNNVKSRCNNCHIRACAICGVTCILNDIRTAPTIIEAEVNGE